MAKRPLEWSHKGRSDLASIEAYYAEHASIHVAREAGAAILKAGETLAATPELYREGIKKGTREYVMRTFPYTLVFRIRPKCIQVVRVMHQARKYFNR